jgi:hypothetical protein
MGFKPSDKPKPKHRKGLWSPEEDQRLRNYIIRHGHGCWSPVPINAGEFAIYIYIYICIYIPLHHVVWHIAAYGTIFMLNL